MSEFRAPGEPPKQAGREGGMVCGYCGGRRERIACYIGASTGPDWTIWEGTGKVSCPQCWARGRADARAAVASMTEGGRQ